MWLMGKFSLKIKSIFTNFDKIWEKIIVGENKIGGDEQIWNFLCQYFFLFYKIKEIYILKTFQSIFSEYNIVQEIKKLSVSVKCLCSCHNLG